MEINKLMQSGEKLQKRVYRLPYQITVTLLLWMLLAAAIVPAFSFAQPEKSPEGMIYCPLSRKFQPENPPPRREEFEPFSDICANTETKDFLFQEIVVKNFSRLISFDKNDLDILAFDFLTRGKSALKELPNLPNFPSENLSARVNSTAFINNDFNREFAWKPSAQHFSPIVLARPPTVPNSAFCIRNLIYPSDPISPRIAPRAPPVCS